MAILASMRSDGARVVLEVNGRKYLTGKKRCVDTRDGLALYDICEELRRASMTAENPKGKFINFTTGLFHYIFVCASLGLQYYFFSYRAQFMGYNEGQREKCLQKKDGLSTTNAQAISARVWTNTCGGLIKMQWTTRCLKAWNWT